MAPSNLSQVFVANAPNAGTPANAFATNSTFSNTAAVSASQVAIWNVTAGTNLTGASATTALMSSAGVLNTALKQIQITQTMPSGNAIASPIIDIKDIKRIAISKYKVTDRADFTYTPAQADMPATTTIDDNIMIRIALRTTPTAYAYFANPADGNLDLSLGGYAFPIVGNFSAGRMIFNVEVPVAEMQSANYTAGAGSTYANQQSNLCEFVKASIEANKTLNAIFKVTLTGSSGTYTAVTLTARHAGVEFDATVAFSTTKTAVSGGLSKGSEFMGVGNYWQVLSDEKSHRARYGNFNRMYFPMSFPEFAQFGTNYDVIDITYAHFHPNSTGIARAADLNNVRIYTVSLASDATNQNAEAVLGYTAQGVIDAFGTVASAATPGLITEWLF
jgi:hypothetical protein